MSSSHESKTSHETKTWLDRYWQVLVIAYGVTFALILALWRPHT